MSTSRDRFNMASRMEETRGTSGITTINQISHSEDINLMRGLHLNNKGKWLNSYISITLLKKSANRRKLPSFEALSFFQMIACRIF